MEQQSGWLSKLAPVLLVAAIIIGLDQWTKEWIRQNVPEYTAITPIESLDGYFLFEHVRNYGAAFGIFQNQTTLFTIIAIVVAIAIIVYVRYLPMDQKLIRYLLGLQLGGAVGNLIDRAFVNEGGYVTDFIKMGIPEVYYWPNYNIADSAIVVGVIGLGIYVIWDDVRQTRLQKAMEAAGSDAA